MAHAAAMLLLTFETIALPMIHQRIRPRVAYWWSGEGLQAVYAPPSMHACSRLMRHLVRSLYTKHACLLRKYLTHARVKMRILPAPVVADPGAPGQGSMLGRTTRVPFRARGPRTLQRAMLRDGAERGGKVRVALQLARARRAPVGAQHRARRHAARPLQRLRVFAPLVPAAAWRA